MSRELWVDIEGFDGYQISNCGSIRTNVPPCGRGLGKYAKLNFDKEIY